MKNNEGNTELKTKSEVERYSALGATFSELTKEEKEELEIFDKKLDTIESKDEPLVLTQEIVSAKKDMCVWNK